MKQANETILGILTVRHKPSDSFRGNRANFRDICRMGRRLGMRVVVFTPEGIRPREPRMECFVYTGRRRLKRGSTSSWQRAVLPLPTVVYNRVPDREAERRPEVIRAKQWLAAQGIPLFNERFFNKRELTEWLEQSPETKGYLPHTEVLAEPKQMARLLRRFDLLYVKPVLGKAGDGILQLRREENGYKVTHQQAGVRTREMYESRQEAAQAVWEKTRGHACIVQQGIALANVRGRLFDLRLLMQKNRDGCWKLTGMGARLADRDGITTHVPNGGSIDRAVRTLCAAFGKRQGESLYRRVSEAAHQITETIEQQQVEQAGGLVGEMSMDIGVDSAGEIYFFEANAKPMKFDEPFIRAKSLLRLLHYADSLSRTAKSAEFRQRV